MAAKHRPNRKKRNCKLAYNVAQRWVDNRIRRIARHLKKYPNDSQAAEQLKK